jgi:hypothetical protein
LLAKIEKYAVKEGRIINTSKSILPKSKLDMKLKK